MHESKYIITSSQHISFHPEKSQSNKEPLVSDTERGNMQSIINIFLLQRDKAILLKLCTLYKGKIPNSTFIDQLLLHEKITITFTRMLVFVSRVTKRGVIWELWWNVTCFNNYWCNWAEMCLTLSMSIKCTPFMMSLLVMSINQSLLNWKQ